MIDPVDAINLILERLDRIILALERIADKLEETDQGAT